MIRLSLITALFLASCHTAPALAADTDASMRVDATAVCVMAGVDGDECVDILSDEYVDAVMSGARNHKEEADVDSSGAVFFSMQYVGCDPRNNPVCKVHIENWATWFLYGQNNVDTDKQIDADLSTYFDEVE